MKIKIHESKLSNVLKAVDNQMSPSDDALPLAHSVWLIVAPKGGGKTTLLLNCLEGPLRRRYDNIFLISPTARVDGKWKKMLDEIEPEGKYYDELNEKNLKDIWDKLDELNEDKDDNRNLIIMDDCLSDMKSSTSKSYLNRFITCCRHKKTSIVILLQKYNRANPTIRNNADLISLFGTRNQRELNTIIDDVNIPKDLFNTIFDLAIGDQGGHNFLHISLYQAKMRMFRNFDKIEIIEEDE